MPPVVRSPTRGLATGGLFELLVVAAGLWVGFRFGVVPGGQVGVDLLLAGAGWWFGSQVARRRSARSALVDGFGSLWLPVLAAIGLTIAWVLTTGPVAADRLARGEALGLVGGYGNWHQIAWGPSEVDGPRLLTSLVHVWPVSVAVQVALAWALLATVCHRWEQSATDRRDHVVTVGLLVAGIAWVGGSIAVANGLSSQALLLSTPTRGVAFVLGAVLGTAGVTGRSTRLEQQARGLVGLPLLALAVLAVVAEPASTWWRAGGSAATAVLATAAVAASVAGRDVEPDSTRERGPIAWFALVAFVVVHGSVLAVLEVDTDGVAGAAAGFGALLAAVVVAGELGWLAATRTTTPAGIERRRVLAPLVALALVVGLFSVTGAFAWESPHLIGDRKDAVP